MTVSVNLSPAINQTLLSLQNIQTALNTTQRDLATGKIVNTALDNPSAFFAAQALSTRSASLANVLNGISTGIQTIQTANDGITSIASLLQQAQSVAQQAQAASLANGNGAPASQTSLQNSFNSILQQITNLANDSSFQGVNLLNSATSAFTVTYDETGLSTQTIQGVNLTAGSTGTGGAALAPAITGTASLPSSGNVGAPLDTVSINGGLNISLHQSAANIVSAINGQNAGVTATLNGSNQLVLQSTTAGQNLTVAYTGNGATDLGIGAATYKAESGGGLGIGAADFQNINSINAALGEVNTAINTAQADSTTLGQNLSTVQIYQTFDNNLINDLNTGVNDLTAADTNAESAQLLALQTQQQIAIQALSLTSQSQADVLKLFP